MNVIDYIKTKPKKDHAWFVHKLATMRARKECPKTMTVKDLESFVPYSAEFEGTDFALTVVGILSSQIGFTKNGQIPVRELLRMIAKARTEARRAKLFHFIWEKVRH